MAHQVFKDHQFLGRQIERAAAARGGAARSVDYYIVRFEHGAVSRHPAPQQCAHAREQFTESKRLGQVVVAAAVQTAHPFVSGIARGQDEHRERRARRTQVGEKFQAVLTGQTQVEQHQVVPVL